MGQNPNPTQTDLVKICYEAYGDDANWTAISGYPMPPYADLPLAIRHHWHVGLDAAIQELRRLERQTIIGLSKDDVKDVFGQELANGLRED